MKDISLTLALSFLLLAFQAPSALPSPLAVVLLEERDHDPTLFTQGLYLEGDTFYQSGGLYQKSRILVEKPRQNINKPLPKHWFAEGITIIDESLYLLTWKANTLAVFDKKTLEKTATLTYQGEGWGLTHNHRHFIMSNGSNQLLFRNYSTFAIEKILTIPKLDRLNELEYIQGIVWANRWYDDHIYAIDPNKGCLLGKLNIAHLRKQAVSNIDNKNITNGIAYDKIKDGLWVTGKFWGKKFLIKRPKLTLGECVNN